MNKSKGFASLFLVEKDHIPVFEKKPLIWEEDMELYSKFLDRKVPITVHKHLTDAIYHPRISEIYILLLCFV